MTEEMEGSATVDCGHQLCQLGGKSAGGDMSFFQLAFGFNGRMRRRDFWLGQILLAFVIGFIAIILLPVIATALGIPSSGMHVPTYLGWIVPLLVFFPAVAIAVKRGHDRNRPAAWIIVLYATDPAIGLLAPFSSAFRPWLAIAQLAILAYVIVDLGLLDGSKEPNRFGPSPKRPTFAEEAAT
jgi:uncharacterized membrane protein YhaH (DUF805 family)